MAKGIVKNMMTQDPSDLQLASYDYHLPHELIAQRPLDIRDRSRLLIYNAKNQEVIHDYFHQIAKYLPSKSSLVINCSKVFACRLLGNKQSGGHAELFLLEKKHPTRCLIKTSGKKKRGDLFVFEQGLKAQILHCLDHGQFVVQFFHADLSSEKMEKILNAQLKIPLPSYIRDGIADSRDDQDYQTVFAQEEGSVAAPTAGRHFTPDLMDQLKKQGHDFCELNLHVGAGTFTPVKTPHIVDHQMHAESFSVDANNLKKVKKQWGQLIAVGTTSLRVLETLHLLWQNDLSLKKSDGESGIAGETTIFLHPGQQIVSSQGLITNFHLPASTLIMLVSAFIGRKKTLELYQLAVEKKYRFYSYGDAMLILK